jgi:hypothetical protein
MKPQRLFNLAIIPAILWSLGVVALLTAAEHSPALDDMLAKATANEKIPVVVFLDHRLSMDDIYPTALTLPMDQRRQYVIGALKARFAEMSYVVMPRLQEAKKDGRVGVLRPLWILNAIRMTADAELIGELDKTFHEVTFIAGDPRHENTLDDGWGLLDMEVPRVWATYGDGTGVVVAHKDAGADVNHSGFQGHFWVNPGEDLNHNGIRDAAEVNGVDDDRNGYIDDFYGWDFDEDNSDVSDSPEAGSSIGHGTKTGSVISANFTPCDTVSVAPGSKLMELSAFLAQGPCWEASQYAIEMGAQVMSASLSFKHSDCTTQVRDCPNYVAHRIVSEMELAAGMIHANSTGNGSFGPPGSVLPAPSSCPPPAMTPAHQQQGGLSSIVSVVGYNQDGSLYTGSGHGPAGWSREDVCDDPRMPFCAPDGTPNQYPTDYGDYPYHAGSELGLAKPDLAAPTNVASLNYNGGCGTITGTSGATPHIGGALALIFSVFPGITPERAYLLLTQGALDAGTPGFDMSWGFGKVRPFPACSLGVASVAHVYGVVTFSGNPLAGVRVSSAGTNPAFTDALGNYELWFEPGAHTILWEKYGYMDDQTTVNLDGGDSEQHDIAMIQAGFTLLTVNVSGNGQPLAGMPISIPEAGIDTVSNASGSVTLNIYSGSYVIYAGALPWEVSGEEYALTPGPQEVDIALLLSPRAAPTGPDSYGYFIYDNYDVPQAAYEWVEINPNAGGLPGINLNLSGDNTVARTLPFTFRFYGADYTNITIAANGFIIMGSSSSSEWSPYPIPNAVAPNNFVAPFFEDWVPQNGGRVLYYSDTDNHRVIVEWYNVPEYFNTCTATFQVMLYDPLFMPTPTNDGVIKYQYADLQRYSEGAIGLENAAGTVGIEYLFQMQLDPNGSPIEAGRALLITTEILSAVEIPTASLPQEFSLEPNFPNPFNPSTTFTWTVPRASHIKLALYNVLGQQVGVVFEGFSSAGRFQQTFDATTLTTGLYFARLETENKTLALRKVMLLK